MLGGGFEQQGAGNKKTRKKKKGKEKKIGVGVGVKGFDEVLVTYNIKIQSSCEIEDFVESHLLNHIVEIPTYQVRQHNKASRY